MEGVVMNDKFWRGKRVFLTGHTGFKGSWLSLWLQSLGAQLTGYALAPTSKLNLFEGAGVARGMVSVIGDIRNDCSLKKTMQDAEPEIVIHMAAQPLVRRSYIDPVETYSTNVMGVVNLLEAVRQTPSVRAVVNVTTDKCYENKEWVWAYRENEPMGGYDPYSNSKGCSELVTAAYRSSYFHPKEHARHQVAIATARAGNVIGGGDWSEDRLIPDLLAAVLPTRSRAMDLAPMPQSCQQLRAQLTAWHRVKRCVNRFVTGTHRGILGEHAWKYARNLFRRESLPKQFLNLRPEITVLSQSSGFAASDSSQRGTLMCQSSAVPTGQKRSTRPGWLRSWITPLISPKLTADRAGTAIQASSNCPHAATSLKTQLNQRSLFTAKMFVFGIHRNTLPQGQCCTSLLNSTI